MRIFVAVATVLSIAMLIGIPTFVPPRPTGPINAILNNLRKIEEAKELWVVKHGRPADAELSVTDLGPFLPVDFWTKNVAGERYIINRHTVPPEAVLTRKVQDLPVGTKLRFGEDGSGNHPAQPARGPKRR